MKKILFRILMIVFILYPINVLADGSISVSPTSLTIEKGSTKSFKITAYNTIGDVTIKSNDSSIASVNANEWGTGIVEEKQTKTGTIKVTGKKIGTTTITLLMDAATFDGDDLAGQTKTITVNVIDKKPEPNLSKNNNIKSISVDGYELTKIDDNNYTLVVLNNVSNINVNATAEDSKAKVTGNGTHELEVGENNIEIIITSESGEKNKINIKVTKKDGYYLEDLSIALKDDKLQEINIIIYNDSNITKEHLTQIKESKKIVRLNYYDDSKKLIYSWIINGHEINEPIDFTSTITDKPDNKKEIYKLSNYADGLYINFVHNGDLPNGIKIKLYIENKFENGSLVNLYQYNNTNQSLDLIKSDLEVKDEYIEFELEHCSEYFLTMSNILKKNVEEELDTINIFMITTIISIIVIIALIIFIIIKLNKKQHSNIETSNIPINNDNINNKFESSQNINNLTNNNKNTFQNTNNVNTSSLNNNFFQ